MYVHILHAGLGNVECMVVACLYDRVNLKLAVGKLAVDWECACVVRTIVVDCFGTAVAQYEASALEFGHRRIAVHYLAVLTEDGCEACHSAVREGDAVHLPGYVFLCEAWLCEAHGCGVHLVADDCRTLKLLNLLLLLCRTHLYNGTDKVHTCCLLLLHGMDAEQIEYLYFGIVAVGWQEMDAAFQAHRLVADALERLHRRCVSHAYLLCHVLHAVYTAVPYDVFNVNVVANECLCAVVNVNDANKSFSVLTEVIKE